MLVYMHIGIVPFPPCRPYGVVYGLSAMLPYFGCGYLGSLYTCDAYTIIARRSKYFKFWKVLAVGMRILVVPKLMLCSSWF